MGLFDTLKKEKYINRLVRSYKIFYGCGDMAAIYCLRKNYSKQELESIFNDLKETAKENEILPDILQSSPGEVLSHKKPFKEDPSAVWAIDAKYKGK